MQKTWEIYNYVYQDTCGDSWYGKSSHRYHIGFLIETEENVISLVNELNSKRRSVYPKDEPEYEWDRDYDDADYITYREVNFSTMDEIRENSTRCLY